MGGVCILISCFATSARLDTIRKRWLNASFPIPYVIVRGNPKQSEECVRTGDIYTLRCDDSYKGLPYKVLAAIKYVQKTFNPDYILKIDDDVILDKKKLFDLLKTTEGEDYVGYATYNYVAEEDAIYNSVYCGGPLYYLSRRAIDILVKHMDPSSCHIEDLLVGKTLLENGVLLRCELVYAHSIGVPEAPAFHDTERTQFQPATMTEHNSAQSATKRLLPSSLVTPSPRKRLGGEEEIRYSSNTVNKRQMEIRNYIKSMGIHFI